MILMMYGLTEKIENVFNPRSFPEKTYVSRAVNGKEALEDRLIRALSMKGNLVFVSGASKSGKTVLCHRVIPREAMISLSGVQIASKEDFWLHIAEQLPVSESVTITNSSNTESFNSYAGKAGVNAFVEAVGEVRKQQSAGSASQVSVVNSRTERQIIKYMLDNNKVLVIDDFHYASEAAQYYVARVLKTELFNGLKAVVVSLPHRCDEVILRNPDLIGRTMLVEMPPWNTDDLLKIATTGFGLLNMKISEALLRKIAVESISSPQLMQENCFNLAYYLQQHSCFADAEIVKQCFQSVAENYASYDALFDTIKQGPPRGTGRRRTYDLKDGSTEDVYGLLLCAMKVDPPVERITMYELKQRLNCVLATDEKMPNVAQLSATLNKIVAKLEESFSGLDVLEYKSQCLYILDPFFLFTLRWRSK